MTSPHSEPLGERTVLSVADLLFSAAFATRRELRSVLVAMTNASIRNADNPHGLSEEELDI